MTTRPSRVLHAYVASYGPVEALDRIVTGAAPDLMTAVLEISSD